ncbi:MAG: nicotinamide-nucleotide adenylyltransferase [Promethearchaeota archaeon]
MNLPPNYNFSHSSQSFNQKETNDLQEETIACFHTKNMAEFHTGRLSTFVFPQSWEEICYSNTPYIYCRLYAWNNNGEIWIQKHHLECDGGDNNTYPSEIFGDSAHGVVYFYPNFSFEKIMQEARRIARENLPYFPLHLQYYDLHFEQDQQRHLKAVYTFITILGDQPTPNSSLKKELNFGRFISPENFLEFEDDFSISFTCKTYWLDLMEKNIINSTLLNKGRNKSEFEVSDSKIGLFIGRFQPFHLGHLKMIQFALTQVDFLKIGIGSSQYQDTIQNPFSYLERFQMITESLEENGISTHQYKIYPIPDMHNADLWVKMVVKTVGKFHIFFSNSEWTRQLFQKQGYQLGILQIFEFRKFNGSIIRKRIQQKEPIDSLVPVAVVRFIKRWKKGIESPFGQII